MTPAPGPAPALVIDCRGRRCPLPILDLARRIAEVPIGSVAAVDADDAAARYDVPAWARMRSHAYLGETAAPDGTPRYAVRRDH
ncbi:MAG: tusA [Pseudonocardiales bacterium]|nr:tusA [Jatrophihabitantaceae bacterium]MCW2602216.1 tusA [Pseudonocardiales bacterium]